MSFRGKYIKLGPTSEDLQEKASSESDASSRLGSNLQNLSLPLVSAFVSRDQCIAHLKFLECLYQLKEDVTNQNGLFGVGLRDSQDSSDVSLQKSIREKRWAVYVARAVGRFRKWWDTCVPQSFQGQIVEKLRARSVGSKEHQYISLKSQRLDSFTEDALPPIDVLMVWHSYLLNPRCFFEDCYRLGKMDFYTTGWPWEAVDRCIDIDTFEFSPPVEAQERFQGSTALSWKNEDDPSNFQMLCLDPDCGAQLVIPWTKDSIFSAEQPETPSRGHGFCDQVFSVVCGKCGLRVNHETLRVHKFHTDVENLVNEDFPLPGTVLSVSGQPETKADGNGHPKCLFPTLLVQNTLAAEFTASTSISRLRSRITMSSVKSVLEEALNDSTVIKRARANGRPSPDADGSLHSQERVAVRRMMSRYWFNSSPFALDLDGAVIRQGEFIKKMHRIDWLHSPALPSTMDRFIVRYDRLFDIMGKRESQLAVPTLCVDLVWHTHQMSPPSYYRFSDEKTKMLIDHDDKIEVAQLNDAFAWTSKMYQQAFGEPYSECTCWYCEAIRASHSSSLDRVLKPKTRQAAEYLRKGSFPSDPEQAPHVSLHNAVQDRNYRVVVRRRIQTVQLQRDHKKALARASKRRSANGHQSEADLKALEFGLPECEMSRCDHAGDVYGSSLYLIDSTFGAHGNCANGSCAGSIVERAPYRPKRANTGDDDVGRDDGAESGCGGGCGACGAEG